MNRTPLTEATVYADAIAQLTAERDAALARAETAERVRDALRAQLEAVTADRADAAERKLAELRPQLDDLRAKLTAAENRAAMHERDADEAHRAVTVLETMICTAVRAVARGVK